MDQDNISQGIKLKICSLNVRGIRGSQKRKKLIQWMRENKFDIVCLQETFLTAEVLETLQREWSGKMYHSLSESVHSKGVSIFFKPHLDITQMSTYKDMDGRRLLVNFRLGSERIFTIVTVYAPNLITQRVEFLKRTEKWIKQHCIAEQLLIVTGDFNSTYRIEDRTSNLSDSSGKHLQSLLKYNSLNDLFVKMFEDSTSNPQFTWIDPADASHQSRLDYIFTTDLISNLATVFQTITPPISDHKAVIAIFNNISKNRGPGYWKMNTSILKDAQYIELIKHVINDTKLEYQNQLDKRSLWEMVKIKIKEVSIRYSVSKAKSRSNRAKFIEHKLSKIDCQLREENANKRLLQNEYDTLKNQLSSLSDFKAKGYQIRSRAKWIEEGEQSTSYFLRLEKKHQLFNQIDALKADNGDIVKTSGQILSVASDFYQKLYTTTLPTNENILAYFDQTVFPRTLTEDEKHLCEGDITAEECLYAVKNLKDNKSPGLDGIPGEFYKILWPEICDLIIDSFNESFEKGELSESQKTSVLSLMFKKSDRTLLKNYRPISLATTYYKIMAFVLANRLHKVIDKIISDDQSGYIKKRFIGTNIRLINDIIEYADNMNIGGAVIFLDFEKAFDSLEWNFMFEALQRFNFGNDFIKWVKTMYKNPNAMVKNNGWLSSSFHLTRGIRQGCPISALLFIIAVEVLALNIKQNRQIKGFPLSPTDQTKTATLSQYADDTILILREHVDVPIALELIHNFGEVSGLKLNLPKTEGIWLGTDKNNPDTMYGIKFNKGAVRCLGIYVGHDKQACYQKNWIDKLEKFQKLLDSWRTRDLTLFGKVLIIKTLALSQLVFSATCCSVTDETKKKITKIIYSFIWHKRDRIKRNTLICDLTEGGINMVDIDCFFDAIKSAWVKRITDTDEDKWSYLPKQFMMKLGPHYMALKMNFDNIQCFPQIKNIPEFYQQVLLGYNRTKDMYDPNSDTSIEDEILWGNLSFLEKKTHNKKAPLFFKNWFLSGLFYVKNIRFINGMVDEQFIYEKIEDKRNILVELNIFKQALRPYRNQLRGVTFSADVSAINQHQIFSTSSSVSVTKQFYQRLIDKKKHPATLHKWGQILNIDINPDLKRSVFDLKLKQVKETKIKEFNYKVFQNILACNNLVSKWDHSKSSNCEICGLKDDIHHLIFKCDLAQSVWNTVATHLNQNISDKDVILGVQDPILNYLFSFVAFTIYKYWLISSKKNQARNLIGLMSLLKADLSLKSLVYHHLKKFQYSQILANISDAIP